MSAPEPRNERHDAIVRAAARVFNSKGYDATAIADVAREVGILKGSLYYYIDSKEDLLFAVIQRAHDRVYGDFRPLDDDAAGAQEQLRHVIRSHVTACLSHLPEIGVYLHDFRCLRDDHRAAIVGERDRYDRYLRRLVEQGQREGTLDPQVDAKLATMALLGMMNWVYHWYSPRGRATADDIVETFAGLMLSGLCTEARSH